MQNGEQFLSIDIGRLMQYYVTNDDIDFNGFQLRSNSSSYNFNSLYLNKNNSYIYMVIQK